MTRPRPQPAPPAGTIEIGPHYRHTAIRYFARYGEWPTSLALILRDRPIPRDIADEARMARAIYLTNPDADYYDPYPRGTPCEGIALPATSNPAANTSAPSTGPASSPDSVHDAAPPQATPASATPTAPPPSSPAPSGNTRDVGHEP
jgi:hypothetical protein